jgi:hypothetical protein
VVFHYRSQEAITAKTMNVPMLTKACGEGIKFNMRPRKDIPKPRTAIKAMKEKMILYIILNSNMIEKRKKSRLTTLRITNSF